MNNQNSFNLLDCSRMFKAHCLHVHVFEGMKQSAEAAGTAPLGFNRSHFIYYPLFTFINCCNPFFSTLPSYWTIT